MLLRELYEPEETSVCVCVRACVRVCVCACVHACLVMSDSCNPMGCSPSGSSVHGIFPDKHTGVGCHFFLQGIFLTQGANLRLLHRR